MGPAIGRRRFLGYVLAAPTLAAAAPLLPAGPAEASPDITEILDLNDLMTLAAAPTSGLITVVVNPDGTVSFALPRAEVGQGITTYEPIRVAAAVARHRLLDAAATVLGTSAAQLTMAGGTIRDSTGRSVEIGALAAKAASASVKPLSVELVEQAKFTVIGTPRNRTDALAAVTGRKTFAMDLDVPDAKPTMVCRAPTINGMPGAVRNLDAVRAMPGVTDVVTISTGVAVRAATFGQCIDAVRALRVAWKPGTAEGKSDRSVLHELAAAELPMGPRPLTPVVEGSFTFAFRGNSALETNCAVADVRDGRAEIWASLKSPIVAQQRIAARLELPVSKVSVHVVDGGGSFGRKLFFDAALEAAEASQRIGKPVKLMWHRADDVRQGRAHPMATSRVRIAYAGDAVLSYTQRHTSVSTDLGHGLGEIITATAAKLPVGDIGFAETFFLLSQSMPYRVGADSRLLAETGTGFNTGSMRNVYSPDVTTARELMIDQLGVQTRRDPLQVRRDLLRDTRARAALDRAASEGDWGRAMPAGTAQGLAVHTEYKSVSAALVEIDDRPETVGRAVREGVTGPRVTKVVFVVDVGLTVNPRGLEAQMTGGVMDGIAQALTASLHLRDGYFLEASWDNYFYTRQWNTPLDLRVVVLPNTSEKPGGAGELAVAASMAAVACAYARATGTVPTSFPINHGTVGFPVKPTIPPIPQSPTDGLSHA